MEELVVDLLELITLDKIKALPLYFVTLTSFLASIDEKITTQQVISLHCYVCSQARELKDKRQCVIRFWFGTCFLYVWNLITELILLGYMTKLVCTPTKERSVQQQERDSPDNILSWLHPPIRSL